MKARIKAAGCWLGLLGGLCGHDDLAPARLAAYSLPKYD
jgi:hypothetical protein